jgi:hypothetical protein
VIEKRLPPGCQVETANSEEPKARILPDEFKDTLEYLSERLAIIEKHCDGQPVEGFTEAGRKKCLALYRSFIQEVIDVSSPLLGGLGERGPQTFMQSPPEGRKKLVQ